MTDIFGGGGGARGDGSIRGPRGPRGEHGERGERGESGIDDLCIWLPHSMLKNYRENDEHVCLLLRDLDRDVEITGRHSADDVGTVSAWISRCSGYDGAAERVTMISKSPSKHILQLYRSDSAVRYALELRKNVYCTTAKNVNIFPRGKRCTYVAICVTFKTSDRGGGEQVVISNKPSSDASFYREITVDGVGGIYITDVSNGERTFVPINHDCSEWTTLLVEWYHDESKRSESKGRYVVLRGRDGVKVEGSFCCTAMPENDLLNGMSIGGRCFAESQQTLNGAIASLEVYTRKDGAENVNLPESLKRLLIEDQRET